MTNTPILIASSLLVCFSSLTAHTLIPSPANSEISEGKKLSLKKSTTIYFSPSLANEAGLLADQLRASTGWPFPLRPLNNNLVQSGSHIILQTTNTNPNNREAYSLNVDGNSVRITASHPAGIFYGTRTLLQLLPSEVYSSSPVDSVNWSIAHCSVEDQPRYHWRGAHLDVSRHFHDIETVKRFIDRIASLKMNVFHWHLTDDDGWRIEIKKYPKLTSVGAWRNRGARVDSTLEPDKYINNDNLYGGFYTQEEIKEIIDYAAKRHVQILPEIDFPGHCGAVNKSYPEYTAGNSNVISASDKGITFMCDVLDEITDLFPMPYLHIGGDEVGHNAWSEDPDSIQRMKELGIEDDPKKLQDWMTLQIKKHLDQKRITTIGWDELRDHNAPKDIVMMAWRNSNFETLSAKDGYKTIAAPLPECYLNYNHDPLASFPGHGYYNVTLKRSFLWNPSQNLTTQEAKNILGGQSCIWTEYIPREKDVDWLMYPRLLALAETFWSPKQEENEWDAFLDRVNAHKRRMTNQGIHFEVQRPNLPFKTAIFRKSVTIPVTGFQKPDSLKYTLDGTDPSITDNSPKRPITAKENGKLLISRFESADHHSYPAAIKLVKELYPLDNLKTEPGLWVSYTEGKWNHIPAPRFVLPLQTEQVSNISISHALSKKNFLLDYSGLIRVPVSDTYTFNLGSDDGSILDISGIRIVDNDGLHSYKKESSKVYLEKGMYPIRIAYLEGEGASKLDVTIASSRMAEQPIPADWLLRSKKPPEVFSVNISTSLPTYGDNIPEKAMDDSEVSKFWSAAAPQKGDHFTLEVTSDKLVKEVLVITGNGGSDRLESGVLEISQDGTNWKEVANFKDGQAGALVNQQVSHIRIRCTANQTAWLVIKEMIVK
ncbi:hexosaminidase [Rubritalea squalenifaciens DSM 18772]|uniref:beta-N-acetylhexosaminidase n=1 Tax=Rubritalea squalenifaciens DSM 18772 TaxID=1123071 RepID=A0A1M6LUY7_9BACT|nr:family 20 glycosylhydrolase [Rubritalea squalenifaciens]SHJ74975.1 hexosaminidase [Rubritalea squalenifaciens DSM 18772]